MSSFLDYKNYVFKTFRWLNHLSKDESLPILWVYWDYFKSVIFHRCLIRQYVIGEFWRKSSQERKRCLTYQRMCKLFEKCNKKEFIHYLNEKPEFNSFFKDFVHRKWMHIQKVSLDEFIKFIEHQEEVIIKPVDGVEGGGIRKYVYRNEDRQVLQKMYENLKSENVLIEEIIHQHPQMVFGNTSVNTIRTHTILDKNGKAHVIKAILRAGVGDSVVDNYCQGGSIYEVDIPTGLVCTYGQSKSNLKNYVHPGTDMVMLGYKIPNWNLVIEVSEKAAEKLPQMRIIGWDVAITETNVELIEGNHNPDYELFEFLGSNGYYTLLKTFI